MQGIIPEFIQYFKVICIHAYEPPMNLFIKNSLLRNLVFHQRKCMYVDYQPLSVKFSLKFKTLS